LISKFCACPAFFSFAHAVIFTCYDFDGTGKLTIDEVTLAMKVNLSEM